MAIKDQNCSNSPETVKALVGETIIGTIADYEGGWWLVVESGHAFVFQTGNGAFWIEQPDAVQRLIAKRKSDLGTWAAEAKRLMTIETSLPNKAS
jgi:hypothetical protein